MSRQFYKNKGLVLVILTAVLLPASGLLAQSDFRVSLETGLELGSGTPKARAQQKPKAAPAAAEKKTTEITCTGETIFDAKAGMAVFVKDVKVNDPQFSLTADKLTAYLKKPAKEPLVSGTASPVPVAVKPEGKPDTSPASGLDRAIAEGNVLITQDKVDEKTGEVTRYVGKGGKAEYNASSGEMILSGWPQIQQGFNNQVATEEGTVMTMDKDGHLRTKGPSMTVIKSDAKPGKAEKPEKTESAKPDFLKTP